MKRINGFSLLEVIISIAALSFTSMFILNMFLVSSQVNQRAKNMDVAITVAITEIDMMKKYNILSDYINANESSENVINNDLIQIKKYYDNEWRPTTVGKKDAYYCMILEMTYNGASLGSMEGVQYGKIFEVEVRIFEYDPNHEPINGLVEIRTKKYFDGM